MGLCGASNSTRAGKASPYFIFSPSHPFVPEKEVTAEIIISLGVRCYVRVSSGLRKNNLGHKHHSSTSFWCSIMADTAFQARSLVFLYPSYFLSLPSLTGWKTDKGGDASSTVIFSVSLIVFLHTISASTRGEGLGMRSGNTRALRIQGKSKSLCRRD